MKNDLNQLFLIVSASTFLTGAVLADSDAEDTDNDRMGRSDCIFSSSIRGYTVLDERNLLIEGTGRRQYHVVLTRRAWGLKSSWNLGIKSPTSQVCAGFSEIRLDPHHSALDTVRIQAITRLTEDEHEDILVRFGKKEPSYEQTPAPREVKGAEVEELGQTADSGN